MQEDLDPRQQRLPCCPRQGRRTGDSNPKALSPLALERLLDNCFEAVYGRELLLIWTEITKGGLERRGLLIWIQGAMRHRWKDIGLAQQDLLRLCDLRCSRLRIGA